MGILDFLDQAKQVVTKWIVGTLDAQDIDKLEELRDQATDIFLETSLGKVIGDQVITDAKEGAQKIDLKSIKNDILGMVSQVMPNIDLNVFKNMLTEVHTSSGVTPTYELSKQFVKYYQDTKQDISIIPNPIIASEGSGEDVPVGEPSVLIEPLPSGSIHLPVSSPNVLNTETLLKEIKRIRTGHIIVSILIGVVGIITEVVSLGQIDAVHEMMSIIYNLSPWSSVYDQSIGMETEANLLRPYRFYVESQNVTNIPPLSDLITMLTREQLHADPIEARKIFNRLLTYYGFSEFWGNAYWGSHWVLPQTGALYEMFGRGIIDIDLLKKQLIINDNHPDWIDKFVELSQRIPSRTEARLISRVRRLTDDKLDRILKAERIHPDFLEDYRFFLQNQELDTIQLQELSRSKDLFISGYITEEAYKEMLSNSVLSIAEQEGSLRRDILDQLKDITDRDVNSVITLFKKQAKLGLKEEPPLSIDRGNLDALLIPLIPNIAVRDSRIDNVMADIGLDFDLEALDA